jgi:hypothetical protein
MGRIEDSQHFTRSRQERNAVSDNGWIEIASAYHYGHKAVLKANATLL